MTAADNSDLPVTQADFDELGETLYARMDSVRATIAANQATRFERECAETARVEADAEFASPGWLARLLDGAANG